MRREVSLDLPIDADAVRAVGEAARDLLSGAADELTFACELSVVEACANVVEHTSSGSLRVVLRRSAGAFSAAVCDHGAPFTPPADPRMPPPESEGGRGVALMAACMDRLRVVRVAGENRLLMTRRIGTP